MLERGQVVLGLQDPAHQLYSKFEQTEKYEIFSRYEYWNRFIFYIAITHCVITVIELAGESGSLFGF